MRSRRRAPRRRSKLTRRGDWVIAIFSPCGEAINVGPCDNDTSPVIPTTFSFVDSQDLLDKEDKLTVLRTVGELTLVCNGTITNQATGSGPAFEYRNEFTFHEGIYVAGADGTTPTANVISLDPALSGDNELDTWMWLRHRTFGMAYSIPQASFIGVTHSFSEAGALSDHIDLRVKRKLERGQELCYACKVTHTQPLAQVSGALLPNIDFNLFGTVRMYVRF